VVEMSVHDTYKKGDKRRLTAIGRTAKVKAIEVRVGQRKGRMGMTNRNIKEMTFSETINLHQS
jgi:hypothetical protein